MQRSPGGLNLQNAVLSAVASFAIIVGGLYYFLFRWQGSYLTHHWPWTENFQAGLVDPTAGALPSFLHTLALGCLAVVLLGVVRGNKLNLVLLVMTLVAERALGVFSWADVLFAVSGSLLATILAVQLSAVSSSYRVRKAVPEFRRTAIGSAALVACCSLFIGASGPCYLCGSEYTPASPVYLSFSELRDGEAVSVESPRAIGEIGRVYLYRQYILLNRRNEGIHVLDNSDPQSPVNVLFISIPGNTELSILNNYLYADSYVDLVTLNLNNPDNIQLVNRQTDIFPWDEYQNIEEDVYFDYFDLDQTRGVVVGYER